MRIFAIMLAAVGMLLPSLAKEAPSRLDLTSHPDGAQVFVDGVMRGKTPCSVFELPAGRHLVHLQLESCVPMDAIVEMADGDFVQKSFSLSEEKGLILVRTEPAGAEVRCNGATLGVTPLLITSLASSRTHQLDLSLAGYLSRRIEVKTEGRTPLVRTENLALDSGTVVCTSEPEGATVLLNGVDRGVTPVTVDRVPKGLASVTFRLAGYREETRELRLMPGDRQSLAVKLLGLPAKLKVVSTPEQAKVFVDDNYQGKTPVTMAKLPAGSHELRVELAGHATASRKIELKNGDDATEEFRLESTLGRLEIATTPHGAKVMVDGRPVGFTRSLGGDAKRSSILSVEGVTTGEHTVLVHLDGYQDTSRKVTVKAKETAQVFVRLHDIFIPDTEVETIRGIHRGVLIEKDLFGNITLETSRGVQQTFSQESIRKVTPISAAK